MRRALRLRQLTRTVRQYGQIRLHNCGLYVEPGWWGQRVAVWVYDDLLRIAQAEQMVVSSPCVYDPRQRRSTEIDALGRQQYVEVPGMQLVFLALALVRTVWRMPRYHRTDTPPSVRAVRQMRLWPEFAD